MGIGVGVVLLVAGAIIKFALQADIPYMDRDVLGVILMLVGALAIILSLVINAQRSNTRHVEERRYDNRYDNPPRG